MKALHHINCSLGIHGKGQFYLKPQFRIRLAKLTPTRYCERELHGSLQFVSSHSSPAILDQDHQKDYLVTIFGYKIANSLLAQQPLLYKIPIKDWIKFFEGYNMTKSEIARIILFDMQSFENNTVFNAGCVILQLKELGFTDESIRCKILPCYLHLLATPIEDLKSSVARVQQLGYGTDVVRRMLLEFPDMLGCKCFNELFPILERIQKSCMNKYVNSGSYHI